MKPLLVGLAAAVLCTAQVPTCGLVAGWVQQGPARSYDASNLFEYMDGNAEGYLLYGFVAMRGVTCVHGGDSLLIDVSEFQDSDSAYGMFAANFDPRLPGEALGAGGQATPRRVIFVKDRFYAELAAEKEQGTLLRDFAVALEKSVPGSTALPAALAWFPAEGQKSVRLIPESVLGLRVLQRGYLAEYEFGKAFVVQEASTDSAVAVMDKLRTRFGQPAGSQQGAPLQITDRYLGRLCFIQRGRYIVGYANVADGHDPSALAAGLASRLP